MVLPDDRIKVIIKKENLQDTEMLDVIESFIQEKQHQEVHINRPMDLMNIQLMQIAYDKAVKYYTEKFKE